MEENGKIWYGTGIDNTQLKADADESKRILRSIGNEGEKAGKAIDTALGKMGKTIATAFSVTAVSDFMRNVVKVRSEIESLEISFRTLLGSKDKASAMLGEIREFAVKTPMMISDLAKGAQTLLSFNVAAEDVMPTLRAIGDISMGDAGKFQSLTLAFSQMSATGKLMGQDLLQMINAGFNPLAEISERTGKSIATLKDEMSKGTISAAMVAQAFRDATSEGGKFYGMLEEQSKGLTGSISNLKGAVDDMFNEIGTKMQDSVSGAVQGATEIVRNYEKVGEILSELVIVYGSYRAALLLTNAIEKVRYSMTLAQMAGYSGLTGAVEGLRLRFEALNKTLLKNPWALAAAAVAALTIAVYKAATVLTESEKAHKRLGEAASACEKEMASERAQVDILFARLNAAKEGTDEYRKVKEKIISQYGEYLKDLSEEIASLKDVAGAYDAITEAANRAAKARAYEAYVKNEADKYGETAGDLREKLYKLLHKKMGDQTGEDGISLAETYYWKIVPMLEGGEMTKEVQDIIDLFDRTELRISPYHNIYQVTKNDVKSIINQATEAKAVLDEAVKKAEIRFGDRTKTEEEEISDIEARYEAIAKQTRIEIKEGTIAKDSLVRLEEQKQQEIAAVRKKFGKVLTSDEETRNKKYWEDRKKQLEAEYEALKTSELSSQKAADLRKQILDAEKKIAAYSVSYKDYNKAADETAERMAKMGDYVRARTKEEKDAEFEIRQAAIDAQKDGFDKQIQQAKLDYDRLIAANEERQRQMVERMRDEKLNAWMVSHPKASKEQQLAYRATITEDDLTEVQKAIIEQYDKLAAEMQQKANKKVLEGLLLDYGDYAEQKKAIDEKYYADMEALEDMHLKAKNNDEKKALSDLMNEVKKTQTKATLDLSLSTIDATAYATVEEKMEAINSAYKEYIENLETAGASEAELAMAKQEQEDAAGKMATLLAQQAELEERIATAVANNQEGTEEFKEWQKLLRQIAREIEQIRQKTDNATKSTMSLAEAWADAADVVGDFVDKLEEVEGSDGFSKIFDLTQGISKAISSGGTAAGFAGLFSVITKAIVDDYQANMERVQAIQEAQMQARLDALESSYDKLLEGEGNIFGEDVLGSAEEYLKVLQEIKQRESDYYAIKSGFDPDHLRWLQENNPNWTDLIGRTPEQLLNGNAETLQFHTKNGFMGIGQQFLSFRQLSEQLGIDLYDEFNNFNADLAQAILNVYDNTLYPGEKEFLESVIKDSEAYKDAMDGIANYLEDLFGGVADTIADNFINSFLESGQAAADFGNVISDVAKSMVKDFVKSKILEVLDPFSKQLQDIMAGEGTQEEKVAQIMAVFASMQGVMDELTPDIQAILEGYQQFFDMGDSGREPSSKGIAQASQDSVDELNGRMTTMQGHTYSISENTILIQQNTANIMQSVFNIERDINDMDNRIYNMETMTTQMRNTLDDFRQNGIRIR